MARKNVKNYSGASGRIKYQDLCKLGPAFAVQPKHDGAYCHVHLDRFGCIARVASRTGKDFTGDQVEGLIGEFVGYPGAVLVGELTAHTEAGNADFARTGQRRVHLFDMLYSNECQPILEQSYSERRAELFRMQVKIESFGPNSPWRTTEHGTRDRSGKFAKRKLRGIQLTPITEQRSATRCDDMWDQVRSGDLEGLVAVSLRAKAGARGAKRKCKPVRSIDALVIGVDSRTVACLYGANVFTANKAKRRITKGDMVEVQHDGWYAGGLPRFPRIVRLRHDLMVDC